MFNRTTAWILVAALAAGLGLLAAWQLFGRGGETKAPQLEAVTLLPQPRELPAFNLRQSDGTPLVAGELAGHWTLVFLGFTFCPDVCPTTLAATADVPALEKFATSLGFVFMKAPGANFEHNPQDYSVDHSAHIAVLDPQGRLAGLIRPPLQPQAIAADLITLDAMGRAR